MGADPSERGTALSFDFPRMAQEGFEAWERDRPDVIAFDTETTGLAFYDTAFCVTAAWRGPHGIEAHYFELEHDYGHMVEEMLALSNTLIGHNLKFDLQKASLAGLLSRTHLEHKRLEDTGIIGHLLDEHGPRKLKQMALAELGIVEDSVQVLYKTGPRAGEVRKAMPKEEYEVYEAKEKVKKELGLRSIKEVGYHLLPREVVVPYAIKDAEFTLLLWEKLRPQLDLINLTELYRQEMALSLVALDMEHVGMGVDVPYAERAKREYGRKIEGVKHAISQIVGKPIGDKPKKGEFNPNSGEQIIEYMAGVGVQIEDTKADTLRKVDHPLVQRILELKNLTKMHGTYLVPLTHEQRNGIIHPNFRPYTKTGRMASGGAEE